MKEKLKNIVGADASVCPKHQRNTQKGITLIALVISIIVMLILAAVSINIMQNQGIIDKSKTAAEKYNQKAEEEQENLTSWEQLIGQYDGTDTTVPQELKSYLLGKDLAIIMDMDNMIFKDDPNTISDASTSVIFKQALCPGSHIDKMKFIIQYKGLNYKCNIDFSYIEDENGEDYIEKYIVTSVSLLSNVSGREGQTVTYKGEEYTVLYDNGDTVEIISNKVMGEYTIGSGDSNATGNNDFEKVVNSYNNAIQGLNSYCASLYEEDSNIISVRSVGSDPENPSKENSTLYTNESISKWNSKYNGTSVQIDKVAKSEDNNWEKDINKLIALGKLQAYNSAGSDYQDYWFASRFVHDLELALGWEVTYIDFRIGIVNAEGDVNDEHCWHAESDGTVNVYSSSSRAVRPVVKIKTSALNFD